MLFSTPMVQAILEGRKIMTRRVVKPQPGIDVFQVLPSGRDVFTMKWEKADYWTFTDGSLQAPIVENRKCPYGKVGDVIWVRETYVRACLSEDGEGPVEGESWRYWYKADSDWGNHDWHHSNKDGPQSSPQWTSSIYMPKAAARIWLEVTDIKVERVQDINEEDAKAEGVYLSSEPIWPRDFSYCPDCGGDGTHGALGPNLGVTEVDCVTCDTYKKRFQILWGQINGHESWNANPFVWVVSFKVLSTTGKPSLTPKPTTNE